MVLIFQLANIQVVQGEKYRTISQKRLFREAFIQAPRGEIYDRNGLLLATNREAFNIQMVKTSIEPEAHNRMILSMIKVLEKNGDTYKDNFPMTINPIRLNLEKDKEAGQIKIKKLKERFKVKKSDLTDEELFKHIREYYKIPEDFSIQESRKVMAVKYEMMIQPFSRFDIVEIAQDVSKETVAELEERHLDFPGVSIVVQPVREYLKDSVAAHVIGYIGKINEDELKARKEKGYTFNDFIGKSGIENVLEEFLKGKDGVRKIEMDLMGRLTGEIGMTSPEPGSNVYLTIDYNLQEAAEKSLEETIKKINEGGYKDRFKDAKTGAVVALDVRTGEVLALASYPAYNPAMFVKGISSKDWEGLLDKELTPLVNRALQSSYSPGSTFKMVTAMAGLQEQKIGVNELIRDLGVYERYRDYQPRCWIWSNGHRTHGQVAVSEAIKVSCNYFFYETGYRTGIDNINKYAKMVGLGSKTGIDLPSESKGILAGPEYKKSVGDRWYPGLTLQAAIGQSDYSFTPIQMANYIAALANGGTRYRPHVISKVNTWDGKQIPQKDISSLLTSKLGNAVNIPNQKLNLNKNYVKAVFKGMQSVTGDAGGTAYATFADFPIQVAGKTGTVQAWGKKSDHAWFVGFAPYDKPEIAVAVIIEHGGHGSYTAPVVKDIFSQYFGFYNKEESKQESEDSSEETTDSSEETADSSEEPMDSRQQTKTP